MTNETERARELADMLGRRFADLRPGVHLTKADLVLIREAAAALRSRAGDGEEAFCAMVDEVMSEEWNEICSDTDHHPLDIVQESRGRLSFRPGHWALAIALKLRRRLATPSIGVREAALEEAALAVIDALCPKGPEEDWTIYAGTKNRLARWAAQVIRALKSTGAEKP